MYSGITKSNLPRPPWATSCSVGDSRFLTGRYRPSSVSGARRNILLLDSHQTSLGEIDGGAPDWLRAGVRINASEKHHVYTAGPQRELQFGRSGAAVTSFGVGTRSHGRPRTGGLALQPGPPKADAGRPRLRVVVGSSALLCPNGFTRIPAMSLYCVSMCTTGTRNRRADARNAALFLITRPSDPAHTGTVATARSKYLLSISSVTTTDRTLSTPNRIVSSSLLT